MATLSHDLDEEQPVSIRVEGNTLTVEPENVRVSVQDKHRVHWFLGGEGTIDSIAFEQGRHPFQAGHHHAKSKKHVLSHTVVDKAHIGKKFKYTVAVTLSNGKQVLLDPEVHVMP